VWVTTTMRNRRKLDQNCIISFIFDVDIPFVVFRSTEIKLKI